MSVEDRLVGLEEPVRVDWERFRKSPEFAAGTHPSLWIPSVASEGVLWAMFVAGFVAATERAAAAHENVNAASDEERQGKTPGAGAMGAVIEYRDLIRKALP